MGEVMEKAGARATDSPACVIEMQWGSSRFLPAHGAGQKYKKVAKELREVLERKGVAVADFQSSQRGKGIFDRYSKRERDTPGAIPSNVSYAAAGPSRLGAFEVWVAQGTWDPARCCPGPGKVDSATETTQQHGGPAVHVPGSGVLCAACAKRLSGSEVPNQAMWAQHTLMHSKIWTRRWPAQRQLLKDIACAVIPPPPPRGIQFQLVQAPRNQFQELSVIPLPAPGQLPPRRPYPEDRETRIKKRLYELDCPAKRGWKVTQSGEDICNCGGGSHWLKLDRDVASMMKQLGFDKDHFLSYCKQARANWTGKDINGFLLHYFSVDDAIMKAKMQELQLEEEQARADIDASHQRVQNQYSALVEKRDDLMNQMEQSCAEWKQAYELGHTQAQRAFVAHCVLLVGKVSNNPPKISLASSVDEAEKAVREVHAVQQAQCRKYQDWASAISCWSDVPEAFEHRPDLAAASPKEALEIAEELRISSEQASAAISQAYPSRGPYEELQKQCVATWQGAVRDFEQFVQREASL